jgi:hypothetical protein
MMLCLLPLIIQWLGVGTHADLSSQKGKPWPYKEVIDGTPLPDSFKPLKMTKEVNDQWIELIRDNPNKVPSMKVKCIVA